MKGCGRGEPGSSATEGCNTALERASTEKVPWSDAYSFRSIGVRRLVSMPASFQDTLRLFGIIDVWAKVCQQLPGCLRVGEIRLVRQRP